MTTPATVDPAVTAWVERDIALRAELGVDHVGISIPERRARALRVSDALAREHALPVAEGCLIDDIRVPLSAGPVVGRVYRPRGVTGALPTQVALHGGGFAFGSVHELVNDSVLSHRAVDAGMQLVSLDYGLAPEHPYPFARDQAIESLVWLREHAAALQVDADRLGIGGASAGASIAASAALVAARVGHAPFHLALEVPAVSAVMLELEMARAGAAEGTEYQALRALYIQGDSTDAFVADSEGLESLPPTIIMVAEHDVLRSGGELLARRLKAVGVEVELMLATGQLHASASLTRVSQGARERQRELAEALTRAYGPRP